MKKTVTILLPALLFVFSMSFMIDSEKANKPTVANASVSKLEIPDDIKSILERN